MDYAQGKMLLGMREAAIILSVSQRTLWARTAPRGPIPAVRIGSRVLYSVDELRRWIAGIAEQGGQADG